jgi:nitroreductase
MSFISQLNWRYATKLFNPEKVVSESDLATIKKAIQMTPSSFGLQPFHVSIITDQKIKDAFLPVSWNQPQVATASHVLVFSSLNSTAKVGDRITDFIEKISGGDASVKETLKEYEGMMRGSLSSRDDAAVSVWAAKQAYIAMGFALAACAEIGVDSCPMEGFQNEEYKKILNLPEYLTPVLVMPIGYRADSDTPRPKVRFDEGELFG